MKSLQKTRPTPAKSKARVGKKPAVDTTDIFPVAPVVPDELQQVTTHYMVARRMLLPRTDQPRKEFHHRDRALLRASIQQLREKKQGIGSSGILHALEVSWEPGAILADGRVKDGARLLINIGETRYWATEDLGWSDEERLPVHIANTSERQAFENAIYENFARQDISPKERAQAIWEWSRMFDPPLGYGNIAKKLGTDKAWVQSVLAPFTIAPDLQKIMPSDGKRFDLLRRMDAVKTPVAREKVKRMFTKGTPEKEIRTAIAEFRREETKNQYPQAALPAAPRIDVPLALDSALRQIESGLDALQAFEGRLSPTLKKATQDRLKNLRAALAQYDDLVV